MSDDHKISELISKSLRSRLDDDENAKIEEHLENNETARNFAELSTLIQGSIVHGAENEVDANASAGLSKDARDRLSASISEAVQEKVRMSQAGLINGGNLSSPTPGPTGSRTIRSNEADAEGEMRQVVSRFRVLRRMGEGGLGNVWLARDERLNRNVAIKEMKASALESPMAWQRFHREAEITGHLEHPNVVPLYHFGEDRKSGEPFYAMRFVGKRTLADAIVEHHDRLEAGEDNGLGLHRLLSIFLDVCQAIAYAHSRGVVHRDIKPENVALDNFGQVIVLDWGLAKILEDGELATKLTSTGSMTDSTLTKTMAGDVVGTPLYMSPEQASGDLDEVDNKTDVYGLGAILFAILTGQAPHQKSAAKHSASINEILKEIAAGNTPKPADIGKKNISYKLDAICAKAMARKRHLRYDSVSDLADAVESWMAGQTQKKASYENLRMEGRELRADLMSAVQGLERNVRFMSTLPPIQELVTAETDEEIHTWRERLSTIFHGLLRANPYYETVVYSSVREDSFTELVRVERHSQESHSIRSVPRSRLRTDQLSDHIKAIMTQKPGDVLATLACDPLCERKIGCQESVGLVVGVPVFDEKTEEVFGVVMINYDINKMLERQLSRRSVAAEIMVVCDVFGVVMHSKNGQLVEDSISKRALDEAPYFEKAMTSLLSRSEFMDETNADIYGARMWFTRNQHGLMYLLRQKDA